MAVQPSVRQLCTGVESFVLPDTRFKTAQITVGFFLPLSRDTVEEYALLPRLLTRACAQYPDFTALNRRLNALYGASVGGQSLRVGEAQLLLFSAEATADRYALHGETVTADCARLLCEMLFRPALENGLFRRGDVETERRCLAEDVRAQINDKRWYALRRAEELLCEKEAYGVGSFGCAEVIERLTPERETTAWMRMLQQATVRVIVQSPTALSQVEEAFAQGFSTVLDRAPVTVVTDTKSHAPTLRRSVERMALNQSKLVMGFRTDCAEPDEDVMATRLMNALLGGTPSSLLFRNVREKLSLCYYCSSSYDRKKGLLFVQSGVDDANANRAEREVLRQVEALVNGRFTDDELEAARRCVIQQFESMSDSQASLASWYLSQTLLSQRQSPQEAWKAVERVNRDAVIRAASRLRCECVYLLAPKEECVDG